MKTSLCGLAALGIFLGLAGQAKGQPSYVFSTFDVPGAVSTEGFGINNVGQIVGRYRTTAGGPFQGFLLSGGSYSTLKGPAFGINSVGQAVGAFADSGGSHGFLLSGGSYTTLNVPGADATVASGINGTGQIVGTYTISFTLGRGVLYNGTSYVDLPVFGSPQSGAHGINASGQIVGSYGVGSILHGYLNSNGVLTSLDPPGAVFTDAYGINDAGLIVGSYGDQSRNHGFLLSGGIFSTIDVPGASATAVYGINDAGQIVGSYQEASGPLHGFLATPGAAPVPEPCTLLLLGVGTLSVIGWTRRRHLPTEPEKSSACA